MARRVSTAGAEIEYTVDNLRRVSTVGTAVEFTVANLRRVSTVGVMVELVPNRPTTHQVQVITTCTSPAASYYIAICDAYGNDIAYIDNFESVEYSNILDNVGQCTIKLKGTDSRIPLFTLDCIVKVRRSMPGMNTPWYTDFVGLFRTFIEEIDDSGKYTYTALCIGTNDLLFRTCVAYKAGTVRAKKDAPAETCMKEYVEENCGSLATVALGRVGEGSLPGFVIEADTAAGSLWQGDRSGVNLLDVVREIGLTSNIDFNTELNSQGGFTFKTYPNPFLTDKTDTSVDVSTGLNYAGNFPVIFSIDRGNVKSLKYLNSRGGEVNSIYMMGKGEASTRTWVNVATNAINDSIYNRREAVRQMSNQEFGYQLTQAAVRELSAGKAYQHIDFEPYQQVSCAYGYHYFLGDKVTMYHRGLSFNKRIMEVRISVNDARETIALAFADQIL